MEQSTTKSSKQTTEQWQTENKMSTWVVNNTKARGKMVKKGTSILDSGAGVVFENATVAGSGGRVLGDLEDVVSRMLETATATP